MGKAEENKKKKRNALLSQAFSLFMNKGIAGTTISDITESAGVGKGTFYFYFKDKEDLIEKLIAQKAEQLFMHALEKLHGLPEQLSVEDTLVFIADDLVEQLIQDSKLLKFINKNLNYGIYKSALTREEVKSEFDVLATYYQIIETDGSEWNDPILMLYTIVELVSSTCHSIILNQDPVDYEYYKPYLFACIRSIVSVFRKN
jgi:AcrR family transcriptional regulator